MKRYAPALLALLLLASVFQPAVAQEAEDTTHLLRFGAAEVTLNARVQAQFNTTTAEREPVGEWSLRRVRLEARFRANRWVGGKIQPDFAGSGALLRDAYLTFDLHPSVRVLAGQAHRPFGILTRYNSLRMPPVEKGGVIRGVQVWEEQNLVRELNYSNRDVGLQLSGDVPWAPLGLRYEAGVFRGPVPSTEADRLTHQLVARLAATPLEGVTVGASWSRRDFEQQGTDGVYLNTGGATAIDLAYEPEEPGLLVLAEATRGDFDPWAGRSFRGANLWLAYGLGIGAGPFTMLEPNLRASWGQTRGGERDLGGTLLTPGVNLYLGPLNRVMVGYDLWEPAAGSREGSLKVMLQAAF